MQNHELPVKEIAKNLASSDIEIVRKAIDELLVLVTKNYETENNPLAAYFGTQNDEEDPVHLPILDESFKKFGKDFDRITLLNLVKMSFREVGWDNYYITILVVEEIIRRKDLEAQLQFIKQFKKACEEYEYGHRFMMINVQDQLYDTLFGQFEVEALLQLLKEAPLDMLSSIHGDCADRLFIPAFGKSDSKKQFHQLMNVLFNYMENRISAQGFTYFKKLQDTIAQELKGDKKRSFVEEVKVFNERYKNFQLLESEHSSKLETLISKMDEASLKEFFHHNSHTVLYRITKLQIAQEFAEKAIKYYVFDAKSTARNLICDIIYQYRYLDGLGSVLSFLDEIKFDVNNDSLIQLCFDFLEKLYQKESSKADINAFREYLLSISGEDRISILFMEMNWLLGYMTRIRFFHESEERERYARWEEQVFELIALVKTRPFADRIMRNGIREVFFSFASRKDLAFHQTVRKIAMRLFPIMDVKVVVNTLHLALISAIKLDDYDFFKFLEKFIPLDIEKVLQKGVLAFNLACGYAIFDRKEQMLFYTVLSIKFGKSVDEFMKDDDFSKYYGDTDFLAALETALL